MISKTALVVFSGGQDSTTCLFWALQNFDRVEGVFFRYGQRHAIEEQSAQKIAELAQIPLHILNVDTLKELGGNSLTSTEMEIDHKEGELPNTFVPGRNLIFLTYAAALAFQKNISDLVTGVCETDYSGYPDCRDNTMKALQASISLGMDKNFTIHTPLMYLDKKATVELATQCNALEALSYSHTCYEGNYPPCGICPSCLLRAKGFQEAGIEDPLVLRALRENNN